MESKVLYTQKEYVRIDHRNLRWVRVELIDYAPPPGHAEHVVVLFAQVDDGDMEEFYRDRLLMPRQSDALSIREAIGKFDMLMAWCQGMVDPESEEAN